jgi:hypothetical protein
VSVERAVVQFVAEGVSDVESAGDRVVKTNAGIKDSADRAKSAEDTAKKAAEEAEKAAKDLGREITQTMHRLQQAAQLAKSIANAAGVEEGSSTSDVVNVGVGALSGAARGAHFGQAFGPYGAAAGAVIGGIAGGVSEYRDIEKRDRERADRLAEFDKKQRENEITDAMLRQLGLAKADASFGGARRVE